ncbi:UNVERIFIED_CONTAM: hypothetical protein Sindi_0157600 [Sesamum indicum]
MAFMKTSISFSLALLATTFVLISTSTAHPPLDSPPQAQDPQIPFPVSPFCAKSAHKPLCMKLTKGAENWKEAMTNSLVAVMDKAKAGKSIVFSVGKHLPGDLDAETKESIDSTCHDAYENMMSNLMECKGFVKRGRYSSLTNYLSSTSWSDCEDALAEFEISSPEVEEFGNEMQKLSSVMLSVAQAKP